MKNGELVTVNTYLYEFVESVRSWEGELYLCRSLITGKAVVQKNNVIKASDKDILSFLNKFIIANG